MVSKCKKGYKLQEGKCIKKKVFLVSSKSGKSYNPFKMWGSWVGAGIGLLITTLGVMFQALPIFVWIATIWTKVCLTSSCVSMIIPSYFIVYTILGFLIGWGIHSLIRSSK